MSFPTDPRCALSIIWISLINSLGTVDADERVVKIVVVCSTVKSSRIPTETSTWRLSAQTSQRHFDDALVRIDGAEALLMGEIQTGDNTQRRNTEQRGSVGNDT